MVARALTRRKRCAGFSSVSDRHSEVQSSALPLRMLDPFGSNPGGLKRYFAESG